MEYELKRSKRKTLAVEIKRDGRVIVRAPYNMPDAKIEKFVSDKSRWINKHLKSIAESAKRPPFSEKELKTMSENAKSFIKERVAFYACVIGVSYGKIAVRCQRTLWGSCSKKGNLNFNCLLFIIPKDVADYVIIHELCHRKEMNHSRAFWKQVETYCPEYKKHKIWLKTDGIEYLNRL